MAPQSTSAMIFPARPVIPRSILEFRVLGLGFRVILAPLAVLRQANYTSYLKTGFR